MSEDRYSYVGALVTDHDDGKGNVWKGLTRTYECVDCGCLVSNKDSHDQRCKAVTYE